jgi:putative ABC transport system permease protein
MLRHNLLLLYRNFTRSRSTFFINLVGLSSGLACALLICLWVNDELRVDSFHANDRRLFQVMQNLQEANGILTLEYTPGILAKALAEEVPGITYASSVVPAAWFVNKGIISFEGVSMRAAGQYIDKNYFNVFTCNFIAGGNNSMLSHKYNVAISEALANKLFKSPENAIGKIVAWNHQDSGTDFSGTFIISAVFENPPHNATAQFELLFNYELFFEKRPFLQDWGNSDPSTFVVLDEGTNTDQLTSTIAGFLKSKFKDSQGTLFLQRYSERYLYNHYSNGVQSGGRIEYVALFSIIAVFILVIACINFMNLSTAKASRRLKEVGIKKTIGAGRRTLILQYLGESTLMSFLSLALAILVVDIFLPQFNEITGKHLSLNFKPDLIVFMLGITLLTGVISGSYPAFYLSSFSPAMILKGKQNISVGAVWTRKSLVVFQFVISIILIVSVLVVYRQIDFILGKNLGYNKDNVIQFANEGKIRESTDAFLWEVKRIPGVVNASGFAHNMTGNHGMISDIDWEGKDPDVTIDFGNLEGGYDLPETLGIKITAGKSFSTSLAPEKQILLNEAAIESMGLKDPVGKTIRIWGKEKQIVGVTNNFHFESLYENVRPCLFRLYENTSNILVRIEAGKERETIARLQQFYHTFNPGLPFDFRFLDEDYETLYVSEQRVASLSGYFAGLAILISCLGLFGLAAFTAERRLKEIGIRKVHGSSTLGIIYLLSGDFTKIVFTAIVIALPVSYLIASRWLDSFAFRITLEWWYFIGAGATALFIAGLTVGTQAIRAATVNPVECLKDE